MTFIVLVCSKCKWARGAKASSKRIRCTRCGASIDVPKARPFGHYENELELAKAVGDMNQQLHDKNKSERKKDGLKCSAKPKGSGPFKGVTGFKGRTAREIVLALGKEMKVFSVFDVFDALARHRGVDVKTIDKNEVDALLERLKTEGLIIEPRIGEFKLV